MEAERCRLVVVASPESAGLEQVRSAAQTGIPQSFVLHRSDVSEPEYAEFCSAAVGICHENGIAALVVDDTRVMGRSGADGLLITRSANGHAEFTGDINPERIVGHGGFRDRHGAMMAGETNPDFVFMGRPGGDIRPEAHSKNLKLAEWWAGIIEIPCIVMAGSDPESVIECAATGADFVAVEKALFDSDNDVQTTIEKLDALLEKHAPRFEEQPA